MARLKTKPVALAGVGVLAASKLLLMDRFRKAKPKPRRIAKAAKIAIPSLLALAGGTLLKLRKGGARKARNFSLVGGAGPAPTNNQTRPGTATAPPATETSAKK